MVSYSLGKNVNFEEVTNAGRTLTFPIVYSEQFRIVANFPISSRKVLKMLPTKQLEPIETKPGTATLTVFAAEYKKVAGLRPYNEFGTFVSVNYRNRDDSLGDPGDYCLHLPVTTEEARWAGVYYYGFPKIVAEIDFKHEKDASSCVVWHDGRTVAEFSVSNVESEMQLDKFFTYTYKDGEVLKTLEEDKGLVGRGRGKGGATLKLGDHMISDELRGLELGEAFEYSFSPNMYSLLHKPSERLPA